MSVWDLYFASVVGWTNHPGYFRENATKPTLKEMADLADQMLMERNKRCLGSEQQSPQEQDY